jgi:hypothetical protein
LCCINCVGVASPDVLAISALRDDVAEIRSLGADPGSAFSSVGDADGLLILTSPGRAWFPTTDRLAKSSPIMIEATGHHAGNFPLGGGGMLSDRELDGPRARGEIAEVAVLRIFHSSSNHAVLPPALDGRKSHG